MKQGIRANIGRPRKPLKTATFGRKECDFMARPSLAEKDILNPFEAIDYFVLSRRKFYDLLKKYGWSGFLGILRRTQADSSCCI